MHAKKYPRFTKKHSSAPYFSLLLLLLLSYPALAKHPLAYRNTNDRPLYKHLDPSFKNPFEPKITFDTSTINSPKSTHWASRKLFREHLIDVAHADYTLHFDFLPDFQLGRAGATANNNTWLNTRAFQLDGTLGTKWQFYSFFSENQAAFPPYLQQYITDHQIVPGQGQAHPHNQTSVNKNVADFANSEAYLRYKASHYFHAEIGYGHHFIGDGYRSLLLSNGTLSYPYFKLEIHAARIHYTAMWAQMIGELPNATLDVAYERKNAVFHQLDWLISKRLKIGFFENVIYRNVNANNTYRGFEWAYANPLVFLRPVEYALGSDDKMLLGLNFSTQYKQHTVAYGQFVLNEFNAKDFFSNNGSYRNKYGYQLGLKQFNCFGLKNLNLLLELNTVMPFTYAARVSILNYGHYNQALAHPLGANFREALTWITYHWKRWDWRMELLYAHYGLDENGLNYGASIYQPYTNAVNLYGNYLGQGLSTQLYYTELKMAYILNPKINLRLEGTICYRKEVNDLFDHRDLIFSIGIRSSFRTFYYDF